jgi:hypothetical protein
MLSRSSRRFLIALALNALLAGSAQADQWLPPGRNR